MDPARSDAKSEWLRRVLQIDVAAQPTATRPVLPIWREAKDAVDAEFERLRNAMKRSEDEELQELADEVVSPLMRGLQVPMMTAILEYDAAADSEARQQAAVQLGKQIALMKRLLDSDPLLRSLEENPLGVLVTTRSTLGSALDSIHGSI